MSVLIDPAAVLEFPDVRNMALDAGGIADGIYSDQLGLELRITTLRTLAPGELLGTGPALLDAVAGYRAATPALHNSGTTFLFTSRSLGADTIGIAYLDGACSRPAAQLSAP